MRTGILLLLAMLSLTTVSAKNIEKSTSKIGVTYGYNDAVTFVERGIQFHVFLNGDFDFNTHYNRYSDYGIRIKRDRRGRVRSVGNVYINYDARGNVNRIGSVFMRYKFGNLFKVGNLHIQYDRWGNPRYRGFVKPGYHNHCDTNYYHNDGFDVNIDINVGDIFDYDDVYFYRKDFRRNYRRFREDNNFYYYRALPNAKIGKRGEIIKRRKQKAHNNKKYQNKRYKGKPEQRGKSRRLQD
ncbi:hypothetical protein P8625_01375 [Tenacibaculum tangerinum]|uniref:Uncharacterized protein n=1 Tax=Tenacibaculum tangerinum TaxID=3038772 RepID=A0ABY8L5F0_9FLAO|nr:hypothetical protein [Tenacibaculum tangerinum]WGH75842.1 hypothetical protein P8625_01375 [Tenacibaculum tangerinum]